MIQDSSGQILSWAPPANEGDVPKWVQRIRLQPEVSASFIQFSRLNPLKSYEVVAESETHYWVVNESGERMPLLKSIAYEIKKPAVSSLPKALVQLSKRKFVAGTMVRVINPGRCYSENPSLARKLGLLNYDTSSWHTSKLGRSSGMVLGQTQLQNGSGRSVCGVRVGSKDYILEESALEAIHNV
jgi:hypothetical protein